MVIAITSALDPVNEADETEEEGVARPIRASSATSSTGTTRKRVRARLHRNRGRNSNGGGTVVQKRRLQSAFRPTRAPLFEASPPDPFIDSVEPTSENYGHSHSPPTRDPYYSPSKFERERKRKQRLKLANRGTLEPVTHNSFDQGSGELEKVQII